MKPSHSHQLAALDLAANDTRPPSRAGPDDQVRFTKEELKGNIVRYADRQLRLCDIAGLKAETWKIEAHLQPINNTHQVYRGKRLDEGLVRMILVEDDTGVKVRSEQHCQGTNSPSQPFTTLKGVYMRTVQIAVPARWKNKPLGDMVRRGIKRADKKDTQPGQQKMQQVLKAAARPAVRDIVQPKPLPYGAQKRSYDIDGFVGWDADIDSRGGRDNGSTARKRRRAEISQARRGDEAQQRFSSLLAEQQQTKEGAEAQVVEISDSDIEPKVHEELIAGLSEHLTNGDDEMFRTKYPEISDVSLRHGLKGLRDSFPAVFAKYAKWVKGGPYMPEDCEERCCWDMLGSERVMVNHCSPSGGNDTIQPAQ